MQVVEDFHQLIGVISLHSAVWRTRKCHCEGVYGDLWEDLRSSRLIWSADYGAGVFTNYLSSSFVDLLPSSLDSLCLPPSDAPESPPAL